MEEVPCNYYGVWFTFIKKIDNLIWFNEKSRDEVTFVPLISHPPIYNCVFISLCEERKFKKTFTIILIPNNVLAIY